MQRMNAQATEGAISGGGTAAADAPITSQLSKWRRRLPLHRVRWLFPALASLILLQMLLAGFAAWTHSPTMNEPAHLAAGLRQWEFGGHDVYRVNPPLVRMVATGPVYLMRQLGWIDYQLDWVGYSELASARPEFAMGERFVAINGRDTMNVLRLSRLTLVFIASMGTWIFYRWGREIGGREAGFVAATLWAFNPMVLGNTSVIAPDAIGAMVGAVAMYRVWKVDVHDPATLLWASIATAVAIGCKSTHVILVPFLLIWIGVRFWRQRNQFGSRHPFVFAKAAAKLVACLMLPIVVVPLVLAAIYDFDEVGTRLGDFEFSSKHLMGAEDLHHEMNRFTGTFLGQVPVPLPADFVIGIDQQRQDFEDYGNPSYLFGEFSPHGWWHYYIWVILLKTPVPVLLLALLWAGCWAFGGLSTAVNREAMEFASLMALFYFIVISSQTGFSHHGRYILPAIAPMVVAISCVAASGNEQLDGMRTGSTIGFRRSIRWLSRSFVFLATVSCFAVTPHTMSFFNVLIGGSENGPSYLLHSNVRRLRDVEPIALIGDSIRVFDASQTRLAATPTTGAPTQILTEMLK